MTEEEHKQDMDMKQKQDAEQPSGDCREQEHAAKEAAAEQEAGTHGTDENADAADAGSGSTAENKEAKDQTPELHEKQEGAGDSASEQGEAEQHAKPDAKDKKIEELTDKYKRLFAEFDNYRKRTDAEKSSMYADGQRNILEKILPIIDNFERAAGNVPEEMKDSAYAQGIEKVCRSSMDTLKALGVEPIEALGKSFDANLHNAVMHVEDESRGENEIVEELQRGYQYKGKVIRYSMVKVAN